MPEPWREDYEALLHEVVGLRLRVTELQRAAARHEDTEGVSLAEREELLRDAERVAHLGTWTWDVASGRVTWSDEMYRILGLEPGSVTPSVDAFVSSVHPEDRASVQVGAEQCARDGFLPPRDCRVVRPDQSIRHTRSSTVMLFDSQGTVRRVVGGVLDRTDSLAVEAKLRRTLGLLEEAQRFAQLGNWRVDPARGELEWSAEFRRIAGLPADAEARAELFFERVVPEDRARLEEHYRDALTNMRPTESDARLQLPDGQIRHVRMTGFVAVEADGSQELRGTMLDVTAQVRMREELAHSQKMEAVGRLAGGIAHDFNNLLTVIVGNLELLARRIGPSTEIDDSMRAVDSAASLTQRLLILGRKAQLSLKVVDPNTLVRSMTELMRRLVGDEVRLEIDLSPDLPAVRIDPVEMERALVNLVVNARDAMPHGGAVYIATGVTQVNGAVHVEFSVGDDGPGIRESARPHIFEPFFTTRRDAGGTGLGLATVLGTAEQHGGTVHVDARPGGGAVFTIVVPAAELGAGLTASKPNASQPRRAPRPLRLLIIDDETRIADVTRRILESHGHTVLVASRPDEALQLWAEHGASIDLVICDIVMAHMRGPELAARMADQGIKPRVLFITGYSEEVVRGAELGHPVLTKPFTSARLLATIAALVGDAGFTRADAPDVLRVNGHRADLPAP